MRHPHPRKRPKSGGGWRWALSSLAKSIIGDAVGTLHGAQAGVLKSRGDDLFRRASAIAVCGASRGGAVDVIADRARRVPNSRNASSDIDLAQEAGEM